MAAMTMECVKRITYDGIRWEPSPQLLCDVDGVTYIKIPRAKPCCCAFARMCFKDTDPEHYSVAASIGYKELVEKRNQAQSAELQADVDEPPQPPPGSLQALFLQNAKQPMASPSAKRPRTSRSEIRNMRVNPAVIQIEIPPFGEHPATTLDVLRPVHPRDDLTVRLDVVVLQTIVQYIRNEGFSDQYMRKPRDTRLPKGIYERKDGTGKPVFLKMQRDGKRRVVKVVDGEVVEDEDVDEVRNADGTGDEGTE